MVAKITVFLCLAAYAAAVAVPAKLVYPAPLAKLAYAEPEPSYPAQYEYSYSVQDDHSGDVKQQMENRDGDAVHGFYSLLQPDGTRRIVEYTADKEHGFNAVVRYEGHPAPAPAYAPAPVAKVAYAAPVAKVAYAAPVAKVAYAAPVAKVAYAAAAPVAYAAPAPVYHAPAQLAYHQAPAPVAYHQAPAHVAYAAPAKVAYAAPLGHVSYSSPAFSYQH